MKKLFSIVSPPTFHLAPRSLKFGACQKGEPAGRILDDFGNFFNGFAKSPRLIILGDPGADRGGEGKSKQAGKYGE